jgi:hypothetical protein
MSKFVSVLGNVILPAQCLQIINFIIERVSISMVNDESIRHRTIGVLPYDNSTKLPSIRVGHLYPSPVSTILVSPNGDAPYGKALVGDVSFLELAAWRQVETLQVFVPRLMAFFKGISRTLIGCPSISDLMIIGHDPVQHMPFSATDLAAEASGLSAVWPYIKGISANFACLCNHALDLGIRTLWFNRCGDLFVAAPSAKPKQLDLEESLSNVR